MARTLKNPGLWRVPAGGRPNRDGLGFLARGAGYAPLSPLYGRAVERDLQGGEEERWRRPLRGHRQRDALRRRRRKSPVRSIPGAEPNNPQREGQSPHGERPQRSIGGPDAADLRPSPSRSYRGWVRGQTVQWPERIEGAGMGRRTVAGRETTGVIAVPVRHQVLARLAPGGSFGAFGDPAAPGRRGGTSRSVAGGAVEDATEAL